MPAPRADHMIEIKRGRAFVDELKVTAKGGVEGYGSVFGNVDGGFDVVESGAFAASLESRGLPKMLWSHDSWEPPIGAWTKAEEDDHGLFLKGKLNLETQRGSEVHSNLKMGTLDGLSIGYMDKESDFDKHGVRHLKELDLFEVSVVNFPMNELARVDAVKQKIEAGISKRDLEIILRDAGLSLAQAKRLIADGFDGLSSRDVSSRTDSGSAGAASRLFT